MNLYATRAEFEALPFRDDETGQFERGKYYRARRYPALAFQFQGDTRRYDWWCFQVDFE